MPIDHIGINRVSVLLIHAYSLCDSTTRGLEVFSTSCEIICEVIIPWLVTNCQNASVSSSTRVSTWNWAALPVNAALFAYGDYVGVHQYVLRCLHIKGKRVILSFTIDFSPLLVAGITRRDSE